MNQTGDTRSLTDAAIAAEQTGRALSLLKQLWHADPSLASALGTRRCAATLPAVGTSE